MKAQQRIDCFVISCEQHSTIPLATQTCYGPLYESDQRLGSALYRVGVATFSHEALFGRSWLCWMSSTPTVILM